MGSSAMERKSLGASLEAIQSLKLRGTEGWARQVMYLSMAVFFFTCAKSAEKFVDAYRDRVDREFPLTPRSNIPGEVFQVGQGEPETFRGRFEQLHEEATK